MAEIISKKRYGRKRFSMLIPLILAFVFVVVMIIYSAKMIYRVSVLNSNSAINDRINNVSALIENHLITAENIMEITSDSIHHMLISGSTTARISEFLVNETSKVSEQFNENYTGLYGYIMGRYMDGLKWEPPADYDPKTRAWYMIAKENAGKVAFVPPYIDAQTGKIVISVCRMLPDKQNVLSMDVQLDGIRDMMNELTINQQGYGFVMDDTGLIIAHKNEEKIGSNINESADGASLLEAINNESSGDFSITLDGTESTVFVNHIRNNWTVVMVVDDDSLYGEVKKQLFITILICVLIFITISFFYYVGRRNEKNYVKNMEEMKLEEQKAQYDKKVLELEKDTADASNRAKSDFLANMSHEIRTPMNAIIGMDEMILRSDPKDPVKKYALSIQSAGHTLLSIINGILDFSKIESGKMELIPVDYHVASVVNDVINMSVKKAEDKGLKYNIEVAKDIPSALRGDEIRIRQIMLNLINNAIKYTHEGSVSVRVNYEKNEQMLQVIVADTGIGIKSEDRDRLFGSFERLDENRNRNIEGTGLGLNIAMRLVKMMDGSLTVDSTYGEGTTFTARMKQIIVDETPIGDFSQNILKMQEHTDEYRPILIAPDAKILIVDDNEMNLEVISALLEETGIKVTTVGSGRDCINILCDRSFDVVLLDQMMPGMSGTETLREIRERHLADDTPVIALTADAIVGAKESYIKKGFSDYLSKPVMYEALEQILLRYLDSDLIQTADEEATEAKESKTLPVALLCGDDPEVLKAEKARLQGVYKCVPVVGEEAMEKYLKKHTPDRIIRCVKEDR